MIDYQYLEGGLTREPEVRFTPNGRAVTTLTLAQSDSRKNDQDEWETTQNRYVRVSLWDTDRTEWSKLLADLTLGTKLVVRGKLVTNQWEKDGQKHSQLEFQGFHAYLDLADNTTAPGNTSTTTNQHPGDWIAANSTRGGFSNSDDTPF